VKVYVPDILDCTHPFSVGRAVVFAEICEGIFGKPWKKVNENAELLTDRSSGSAWASYFVHRPAGIPTGEIAYAWEEFWDGTINLSWNLVLLAKYQQLLEQEAKAVRA
jgi:hypothetical protein